MCKNTTMEMFQHLFDIQHRNVWSLDAEKKHPSETNKESQWIFFCRILKGGCSRGGCNWGTLRIPRGDWGTLGNIRED